MKRYPYYLKNQDAKLDERYMKLSKADIFDALCALSELIEYDGETNITEHGLNLIEREVQLAKDSGRR